MVIHLAAIPALIGGANGIITLFEKGIKISKKIREIQDAKRRAALEQRAAESRAAREEEAAAERAAPPEAREETKAALEERAFQTSLATAPPRIRAEYDSDFKNLGPVFEQGDDIARESLKDVIIAMQTKLLAVLEAGFFSKNFSTFNYADMQDASDSSRMRTVTTLAQCFQRLAVKAPIIPSPSIAASNNQSNSDIPTVVDSSQQPLLRIALFTFESTEVGDLTFRKGDIIIVIKKPTAETDLWWKGQIGDRTGIFPLNYTKEYIGPPTRQPDSARHLGQLAPINQSFQKEKSKHTSYRPSLNSSSKWPLLSNTTALCPGALVLQNSSDSGGFTLKCVSSKPDKNGHSLWAYRCNYCKFKHEFRDRPNQQRKINEFPFETCILFSTKVRAKWTFFAMSHKPVTSIFSNSAFYCVFCITEGKSADMFKVRTEATLKSHIHDDHRNGVKLPNEKVRDFFKCLVVKRDENTDQMAVGLMNSEVQMILQVK